MANLLRKSPVRKVVGGSPALPGRPDTRHYAWVSEITGPLQMMVYIDYYKGKPRKLWGMKYPTKRVWKEVGSPPVAAQPAIPGKMVVEGAAGWDGGARSLTEVPVGGSFVCTTPKGAIGIIVGLAQDSSARNETWIEYGIRFQVREPARIVERGQEVAVLPGYRPTRDWLVTIQRTGDMIRYFIGGILVHTTRRQDDRRLYGAAVLYSEQDYVSNAAIGVATVGSLEGAVPRPVATIYDADYNDVSGLVPRAGLSVQGRSIQVGSVSGTVPRILSILSDGDYAQVDGRVPPPTLSAKLGPKPIEFVSLGGLSPRPILYGHMLAGEVGTINAGPPAMNGALTGYSDTAPRASYGSIGGVWPSDGYQGALIPIDTEELTSGRMWLGQSLLLAESYELDQPILLVVAEEIRAGATVQIQMLSSAAMHEMVAVSSSADVRGELSAVIRSAIACSAAARYSSTGADGSLEEESGALFPGNAALGYAVNILTGALAEHDGQQFSHMARAGGNLWAIGRDGLYRLAEGGTLSALLDLGTTGQDGRLATHVTNAFVGIRTDGELYLRATTDGVAYVYKAIPRKDTYRFDLAKGVSARNWSFALELVDASYASIDSVEFLVGAATRRRGGRR